MLFLSFLNAHKKIEFQGALLGGYNYTVKPQSQHSFSLGVEVGIRINIGNHFFITPLLHIGYSPFSTHPYEVVAKKAEKDGRSAAFINRILRKMLKKQTRGASIRAGLDARTTLQDVKMSVHLMPMEMMLRVGGGARGISGYGIIGGGATLGMFSLSTLPSTYNGAPGIELEVFGTVSAGAGIEYRYKKVGFFVEGVETAFIAKEAPILWQTRGLAGISVFL